MMNYREKKEAARNKAIEWLAGFEDRVDSYESMLEANAYFEKLGRRYGLTQEFKENGII